MGFMWGLAAGEEAGNNRAKKLEEIIKQVEKAHLERDHLPGDKRNLCSVCVPLMEVTNG